MAKKILYIEDEPFLGRIVKETLELKGFEVLLTDHGKDAVSNLRKFNPDICLLDVMLPHVDGFTLGKQIRSLCPLLPIIFITAKTRTDDLIEGFASGGTDYIRKPFSIEELNARINNQLQLSDGKRAVQLPTEIALGNIRFLPGRYELHNGKEAIKLSHREAQILIHFATHQNQVIARKDLLIKVWGDDSFFNSRTLDVYVRKLRGHFSPEPRIEIITLKGMGYHFLVRA